jgi:hypothetical protein
VPGAHWHFSESLTSVPPLEPVRPGAVSPDRALCLPSFSHFLILNKTSLSVSLHWYSSWQPETLEVFSDIKHVLKEDAVLALNFDKTKIFVKGISAADAHAAAQRMLNADPSLVHLRPVLSPASFVVDGYIGLGVPIGTDAVIQHFVKDKYMQLWRTSTSSTTSKMCPPLSPSPHANSFGFQQC